MPQKNYFSFATTSIAFLVIGMLILSFKLYKTSRQNESLKDKLSLENTLHQNQISEILKRYDSLKSNPKSEAVAVELKFTAPKSSANSLQRNPNQKSNGAKPISTLRAVDVNVRGVRLIGKDVIETNQSTQIDQLRVCFTLESNKDVAAGKKQIIIQILNPKNRVINLKNHSGNKLDKEVYYDRLDTDACMFVNLYQHELIVGEYKINLLCNNQTIGSTVLKVN